jgi:NAD+ synthase (glutamine-hydrolysing)
MRLRLAMVQMNAVVGDLEGNGRAICQWIREAKKAKADVVVFPELAVCGYPPEDLLLMPKFLADINRMRDRIAKLTTGIMAVVGSVVQPEIPDADLNLEEPVNKKPFNAAWIMADGQMKHAYAKWKLPNYGVFDEERYFQPGKSSQVYCLGPVRIGINICEDIWFADGPVRQQAIGGGAHVILNINASPYHIGKTQSRESMLAVRAKDNEVILSYTNMVGGQDELVFDGNSFVMDAHGLVLARAQAFAEDLLITDLRVPLTRNPRSKAREKVSNKSNSDSFRIQKIHIGWIPQRETPFPLGVSKVVPVLKESEEIYRALVLGVKDYVRKNTFSSVLVGISGGIDSALTAVIARDALGPSQVMGVMMPSSYTSQESRQDSRRLGKHLGIRMLNLPITSVYKMFLRLLHKTFQGYPSDTTEENLQARIRGTLLMALSNKFGSLVLTTGNKSEMSVGYSTLYGDMAGGFAVIKDVYKMKVYQLTRWRSEYSGPAFERVNIPERIQTRAPSAELKPNQKDQDTLPPYPHLDAILQAYVEHNFSQNRIVKLGYDSPVVSKVMQMVDRSEYKRRQAPVGIKITARALGKDRRMPITNRYPSGG